MDNKILQILNEENVLSYEFLYYFNSPKYVQDETILSKFLDKMISTTEILFDNEIEKIKPITVLKSLVNTYYVDINLLNAINKIINSDKVDTLSILELFSILWWLSCKNIILFEQSYYYLQAKNGNIGKVLITLKNNINNKINGNIQKNIYGK